MNIRLSDLLLIAIFLAVLGGLVHTSITIPTVYYSYSTGECVHIEPPSTFTCSSLPDRYTITWAQ